ncbi:MAG: 1-acyl-sn-glycerol-3-phosphate acyltransferase [Spirochaetaceae bacterium]|jgi:1-acyl-sn-glycerol-3-phosphate acyltransferase|nr:1-acyl-sn-glycerol-3-phosphate acyltransferase [Spirochaetaceae bacterium]
MFAVVHTVFAFFIVGVTAVAVVPLGIILFVLRLFMPQTSKLFTYKIAQFWSHLVIKLTGCRVTAKGREHIPQKGPVCIASNHCGIFDIVLLLAYLGRPFGFVAKSELAFIPVINIWILFLGGQYINRKNIRKSVKTIGGGVKKVKHGGAMIIFPEGTRSKGRGLLPFKAGSLRLATEAGAPIVPVAIAGSYEVFEKTRLVQRTQASITFCPVIETKNLPQEERRQVLADRVRDAVAAVLAG